jgi:hypothetical protein
LCRCPLAHSVFFFLLFIYLPSTSLQHFIFLFLLIFPERVYIFFWPCIALLHSSPEHHLINMAYHGQGGGHEYSGGHPLNDLPPGGNVS